METQIITTSVGPIIKLDDMYASLNDSQMLISIAEADPEIFEIMPEHLISSLSDATEEFLEGFKNNMNVSPQKIYSYVNSTNQWIHFVNATWRPYVASLQQVQEKQ